MEITLPSMSDKKWTCADLLSSYRFWGITFFFLVLSFISSLGSSYGVYFWSKSLSIPADRIGVILVCGQLGYLLGMVASWGNDSNLLIVFYVQIMPDDFVMQLHRF